MVQSDRPRTTICACALNAGQLRLQTHTQNVLILTAFTVQQWLGERASKLRYTHVACFVRTSFFLSVGLRQLMPRMYCSHRLIVLPLDVPTLTTSPLLEILAVKGGTNVGEKLPINFAWNARLSRNIQGSFTCRKSTWDQWLYFPSEGSCAEDFFALKNPRASAGFEPAKLWY
jgi:hypothetical protein